MAGETLAFVDAFENTFIFRHDLSHILRQNIPILMLTDSKALFDVLSRARYTTERRLMVSISATREANNQGIISNIGVISSDDNPADRPHKDLKQQGPSPAHEDSQT